MTVESECDLRDGGESAARYVAGTLAPQEVDTFERHLLECSSCQRAIHEAVAVRSALHRRPSRRIGLAAATTLAAAAVAALLLPLGQDRLQRLGRVGEDLPRFEGLPVRSDPDAAASLADSGMDLYARGDYAAAAALLERAVEGDPTPGTWFFLGIARLKSDDAPGAIRALEEAAIPAANPYRAEARLFLAKAHLSLGDAASALAELEAVPATASEVAGHARALADSVRRAMR